MLGFLFFNGDESHLAALSVDHDTVIWFDAISLLLRDPVLLFAMGRQPRQVVTFGLQRQVLAPLE